MKNLFLFLSTFFGFYFHSLSAQNGALDSTFGSNSTGCFNPVTEAIMAHIVLEDNSIICASYDKNAFTSLYQGSISKFTADGSFDLSFGPDGDGSARISDQNNLFLSNLAIASDGSIFTCSFDPINATGGRIYKLSAGGQTVTSFGVNGALELPDFSVDSLINGLGLVEIDNQGRILVTINITIVSTNTTTTCLARLLPNGAVDESFGNGGFYFLPFPNCRIAQILQTSDEIILAGSVITGSGSTAVFSTYCLKLTQSGQLITTFGTNGTVELSPGAYKRCTAANLMPDGRIALLYFFPVGQLYNSAITMLSSNGGISSDFATNGTFTLNLGASILAITEDMDVLPDGSIVAVGNAINSANSAPGRNVLIFKLNPSGTLDSGFGSAGIINEDYAGGDDSYANIAFQNDYKLILTGNWSFQDFVQSPSEALTSMICRRNLDYTNPTSTGSFSDYSQFFYPNPLSASATHIALQNINTSAEMQIVGCDGRLLDKYKLQPRQNSIEIRKPLNSGVYFVTLTFDGIRHTQKLVVQ